MVEIRKEHLPRVFAIPAAVSVLIRSSSNGEACFYHAPIERYLSANSLILSFHKTSLILERLRMLGSLPVTAELGCHYLGELKIADGLTMAAITQSYPVLLELYNEVSHERGCEQPIIPRT